MREPLRLTWRHTWPDGGADFTAGPEGDFACVYQRAGVTDPEKQWFWSAAREKSLGSGIVASKRAACEAAEAARFAANAR
jgi:hypothetical protein